MKTARTYVFVFVPIPESRVTDASRVLVSESRRKRLCSTALAVRQEPLQAKFAIAKTASPARETSPLPNDLLWTWFIENPRPSSK
jgi:hypothetical protein